MARLNLDEGSRNEPRILKLARLRGSTRQDAFGRLIDVWWCCYHQLDDVLERDEIDLAAEAEGFADQLVACRLAEPQGARLRIKGARERIDYLLKQAELGRRGGIAKHQNLAVAKPSPSDGLAVASGPLKPTSAPDLLCSGSAPAPDLREREDPPLAPLAAPKEASGSRRVRKAKSDITPEEAASAERVLGKITDRTGVAYRGSAAHIRLITQRLRDGIDELDLRAVIGYAWDATGLGWEAKPEMHGYLRPETLFGPVKIEQYLPPARAWRARFYPDKTPQTTLAVVK